MLYWLFIFQDDLLMPSDVTITDTSKVGVQVNGGKIPTQTSTALHEGDVVSFGKMQLKFKYVAVQTIKYCW